MGNVFTNIQNFETTKRNILLVIRLIALAILVSLLTLHLRSVRVFKWEQSVSGGLLVTYSIATLGLALFAGRENSGGHIMQMCLCATGAILLTINAGVILRRWSQASEMTRAITELLEALGIRIRRQIMVKAILSATAAMLLMADFVLIIY